MKVYFFPLIFALSLSLFSCQDDPSEAASGQAEVQKDSQRAKVPKDSFILEKGLYIENNGRPFSDSSRNNVDNKIFLPNRIFAYNFEYKKPGEDQIYYFTKADPKLSSSKNWEYVLPADVNERTVTEFWYVVEPGLGKIGSIKADFNKTVVRINYAGPAGPTRLREWNGLIENAKNLWMYPPRNMAFAQLALNPYPYVQFPLAVGNNWSWRTDAELRYSDARWVKYDRPQPLAFLYKVIAQETIDTPMGALECWKIEAGGNCPAGSTSSIFYFHPEFGFVRIEHITINGGSIVCTLKGIGSVK